MAKFKCVASGEIYSFELEHDIKSMRTHPGYEEIVEQETTEDAPVKRSVGRPPKAKEE